MNDIQERLDLAIRALQRVKMLTRPESGPWLAANDALEQLRVHSINPQPLGKHLGLSDYR